MGSQMRSPIRKSSTRTLALACLLVATVSACGAFNSGSGPGDAKSIRFEVQNADGTPGTADVTYDSASGHSVSAQVATPWVSEPVSVGKAKHYRLTATRSGADPSTSNLYCGADSGSWKAGSSSRNGRCAFTYPDDAEG